MHENEIMICLYGALPTAVLLALLLIGWKLKFPWWMVALALVAGLLALIGWVFLWYVWALAGDNLLRYIVRLIAGWFGR